MLCLALSVRRAFSFAGVASLTSTDKSVCATPSFARISSCAKYGRIVWHRHSCLCFGKMQRRYALDRGFVKGAVEI
jgi:hypothetical protein